MNWSVVVVKLLTRPSNSGATANSWRSQRADMRRRAQSPETSSAGTSLGSLQNSERHNCSHCAYSLDLVRSWYWKLPLSDPVIWGNDKSDFVNATTTGTELPVSRIYKHWIKMSLPLLMFKISSMPYPMLPLTASDVGIHILDQDASAKQEQTQLQPQFFTRWHAIFLRVDDSDQSGLR